MKVFGVTLKPLFGRSGYSYTSAARRQRMKVIDTKAIFADGVALGRMLAGEATSPRQKRKRR
jgi:hypothetical protein